jgi:class 3 adenylate cyclase/tetratricopeptide (TPR) repeat protein
MTQLPSRPADQLQGDFESEVVDLLAAARNLEAVERCRTRLRYVPNDPFALYNFALASANCGATQNARDAIKSLRSIHDIAKPQRAKFEALAGRVAKERYRETGDALFLQEGIDAYQHAALLGAGAYAYINAASLLFVMGRLEEARVLAQRALDAVDSEHDAAIWADATRAEAYLLLGDNPAARAAYRRAYLQVDGQFGALATMRRQLILLSNVLPSALDILGSIPGPVVTAFSGHMIDAPQSSRIRFPAELEPAVAAAISGALDGAKDIIGYSQAACGSDLLFCEALLERGQELNVILPFVIADYLRESVEFAGPQWVERFHRVLSQATSVTLATEEPYLGDDALFEHASTLIQGCSFLRAEQLQTEVEMLAVADASHTGLAGGTLHTLEIWGVQGARKRVINLGQIRAQADAPADLATSSDQQTASYSGGVGPPKRAERTDRRSIKSLLFADVRGFSRLSEEFAPAFFTAFLGLVPKTMAALQITALEISSRGDGLYAVFQEIEEAARFALALSDGVGRLPWSELGLPSDTHIRIALHQGPVFSAVDPVTSNWAHYGSHVTRAARIEPVVIPGQVFASEAFAASLAARLDSHFTTEFVGSEPLAKEYGTARLYRLRTRERNRLVS